MNRPAPPDRALPPAGTTNAVPGSVVPTEIVQRKIFLVRGHKVMLDSDLADIYGTTTFNLNKAVKRNCGRFPADFMFQLTGGEFQTILTFQFGISRSDRPHGGRRHLPYAFTEHGVAMLSSVLRSERAIQVNIAIMRAFASLREWMSPHRELARRIEEMEGRYDAQFKVVFDAIRALTAHPADEPRERIGFRPTPIPAGRPDAPLSRPKARETIAA